ncbi:MAG TPA: hypothetical protein VFY28_02020 [Candidatus Paceibacterota bacterium]|nr:hypothetical protein [Candidatus Paceibacterota bacterium]
MKIVYEVLVLAAGDYCRTYHLESNIPCPSPVGTSMLILTDGIEGNEGEFGVENFFLTVQSCIHSTRPAAVGDGFDFNLKEFAMKCGVVESRVIGVEDDDDGRIFTTHPEVVGRALERHGWKYVRDGY